MYFDFQDKTLRDLAWVLDRRQDLLLSLPPYRPFELFTTSEQLTDWLQALTNGACPLHPPQVQHQNKRLGIYFEDLVACVLQQGPGAMAWERNLPVRRPVSASTAVETIGELDFLLRQAHVSVHLEVAVKFYLGLGNHWLGPDPRDSFAGKCQRMAAHQLPLSLRYAELLQIDGPIDARFWVKGYLFQHWRQPQPYPPFAHPNKPCRWLTVAESAAFFSEHGRAWIALQRSEWLGGRARPQDRNAAGLSYCGESALEDHFAKGGRAVMLSCALPHCWDCQRLFVVDNSWPGGPAL